MELRQKMIDVMTEVSEEVVEREELIRCIAIALLTGKNLFILGNTGQAKSYAIDRFRTRIKGAKQFKRTLSKQADEEALFGRLDLGSLIPGNVARDVLENDATYTYLVEKLAMLRDDYADKYDGGFQQAMALLTQQISDYKKTLSELNGSTPSIITAGKIPDSHIVFIDEIFKANDGILNSLLEVLNEHTYTNEGRSVNTPVISFFAASNEIPNFKDPAERILLPLYDRFELKLITDYVQDRMARLNLLKQKQCKTSDTPTAYISLDELYEMQKEIGNIEIPDAVNTLMDDILCELRRQGIHISDRKYFGYFPIVQAKAWMEGKTAADGKDLLILKYYLWTVPEELPVIEQTLKRMCENPLGERIGSIHAMASESFEAFESDKDIDSTKAILKFRTEFISLFHMIEDLKKDAQNDSETEQTDVLLEDIENMSRKAHEATKFTYLSLEELSRLQ